MTGLTEQQVHELLHILDADFDKCMGRAERASENGAHHVAAALGSKANGILQCRNRVLWMFGMSERVWAGIHSRTTDALP